MIKRNGNCETVVLKKLMYLFNQKEYMDWNYCQYVVTLSGRRFGLRLSAMFTCKPRYHHFREALPCRKGRSKSISFISLFWVLTSKINPEWAFEPTINSCTYVMNGILVNDKSTHNYSLQQRISLIITIHSFVHSSIY